MRTLSVVFFVAALTVSADTLHLRDGSSVRGTFISGNGQNVQFRPDGGSPQTYAVDRVGGISFGDSTAAAALPPADSPDSKDRDRLNGRDDKYRRQADDNRSSRARSSGDEVPAGTAVTIRMVDSINSNSTDVGKRYRASLDADLVLNGNVVAPRGSDATAEVVRVDQARAIAGKEEIGLVLSEIVANGRKLTPVTQDAQVSANSRGKENIKVIGGTAALGAIIGAIAGGGRGAAIGAASGAGAGTAVQAIRGQKIEIPSETQLTFTLSQPMRF